MKLTFTEEQIANELHKIYLEEDDLRDKFCAVRLQSAPL